MLPRMLPRPVRAWVRGRLPEQPGGARIFVRSDYEFWYDPSTIVGETDIGRADHRTVVVRGRSGDVPLKQADRFIQKVQELEDSNSLTPVIYDEGVSYLYVQVSGLSLGAHTAATFRT